MYENKNWTEREAFIDTVLFRNTGKIPFMSHGPRESTLRAWEAQGMDANRGWFSQVCGNVGIPYIFPKKEKINHGVNFRMIPWFEEKILEHRNGHYILQDWMGNIVEISDEYDFTYIRSARDFVTRKWHRFPVTCAEEFDSMKSRYSLDAPGRLPEDFKERCDLLAQRDYVISISIPGLFWQMREWCGFEPLCTMFLDNRDLILEMVEFWSAFVDSLLQRIFQYLIPDKIHISEDMAYKGASMISPAMTQEYLLPVWSRWAGTAKSAGVKIVDMDSDGFIGELIPLWIEAGINLCDPIEVAAGNDIVSLRRKFRKSIAYEGGIDKRCIAAGGVKLEEEMFRIEPVVAGGGYIPGCDHGIPPDVSWDNMHRFVRIWAEMTGWL